MTGGRSIQDVDFLFFSISPSDLRHRTIVLCRSELILTRHENSILSHENYRDVLVKSGQLFASITGQAGTKADRNFGRRERLLWVLVASLGPSAECRARFGAALSGLMRRYSRIMGAPLYLNSRGPTDATWCPL